MNISLRESNSSTRPITPITFPASQNWHFKTFNQSYSTLYGKSLYHYLFNWHAYVCYLLSFKHVWWVFRSLAHLPLLPITHRHILSLLICPFFLIWPDTVVRSALIVHIVIIMQYYSPVIYHTSFLCIILFPHSSSMTISSIFCAFIPICVCVLSYSVVPDSLRPHGL